MRNFFHTGVAIGLLMGATASTGCRNADGIFGVDRCANVPCGAIPNMPGSHLCEWQHAQVANASIDRFMFYQADFVGTSDRLGPAAGQRVDTLVHEGVLGAVDLYVEPSGEAQRDAARVVALASAFNSVGVPITPDQIQIAYPPAIGLDGFQAQQVSRAASRSGGGGGQRGGGGGQLGGGGGQSGGGFGGGGIF
jgi:uncharacterized membrane protein YgcG